MMRIPRRGIGRPAVHLILRRREGAAPEDRRVDLGYQIVERETS